MYSIFDTKAEQYGNPVCVRTDAEARRQFGVVASDPTTEIGKHPEDFMLFRIGSWDAERGNLTAEPGTCVAKAIEFIKKGAE